MIEFIVSGVVCLVCVVIAVLVFMKVDDIRNLNTGTHAGREVMIWLYDNPNSPMSSIIQKTKEIERQNKDSKIVLKMTQEEFDSIMSKYHSRDGPGSFLVIITNEIGNTTPPQIEYIYDIDTSFPYTKYMV
jgi:phosphopantothenoylcysteine synthetase/decarboxylase